MAVTYGFYNSLNGDRAYNAVQMSSIFDGIVVDGVLMNYGDAFRIGLASGMAVTVGIGRAWFNHTWTLNDAILPVDIPPSELVLNRIDAVVIDIDTQNRVNTIKVVSGAAAATPSKPVMIREAGHWQYPLCYISVRAGTMTIGLEMITNAIGTSECPYATSPLQGITIDRLIAGWDIEWKAFMESQRDMMDNLVNGWTETWNDFYDTSTGEWDTWFNNVKDTYIELFSSWEQSFNNWYNAFVTTASTNMSTFMQQSQDEFNTWFASIQGILSEDEVGQIVTRLNDLTDKTDELEGRVADTEVSATTFELMKEHIITDDSYEEEVDEDGQDI